MRKKLTPKSIEALPAAEGKRYEIRDQLLAGLHIRVSSTGAKVFYVATRVDRVARRIKIGTYPIISLADARDKAREILRDIQLGHFQKREQTPEPTVLTLGEIVPQFIDIYAKHRNRDWKGKASILQKFNTIFPKKIDAIKRADVVRILDGMISDGTPFRANRALAALKKLFAWCVDRGTIEYNPLAGLKAPAKEVARDRVLEEDELRACWNAAAAESPPFDAFVKLLILTGQRRGEVGGMRWSELNLEKAIWAMPAKRTKNATMHTVPLAPMAIKILEALPRFLNSDFVFTTTGTSEISGFGRLKARLDLMVGGIDWRLHDIRRTVATNMAIMRIQPHIIEAVLNHKTGIVSGVAAVYNRHAYLDEKREALEKWANSVAVLVNSQGDRCANRDNEEVLRTTDRGFPDCGQGELRVCLGS
ncbi:site-specific integrase [Mesorhizobium sp.]|uniref:tyrosine-type recombinase/integrase n=1 Tax=Mesorhizobium sp. TaxID=1871066 RepID=UPI001216E45F|nr:site-specific integrase [Mesorhizobium sp.]TIL31698.1 MAG: DUF4102 domain-containing protein [Mesorhizobium sp.]